MILQPAGKTLARLAPLVLCLFSMARLHADEASPRVVENFNRDWKFQLGDPAKAESAKFDDSAWQAIGLPHSFSMPYFMHKEFYTGYGWYRKSFDIPAAWKEKRISLEFEAAFQDAEIFVNGTKIASHRGGYVGFPVDLTGHVKGGNNLVAVRLNNLWNAGLAPRAGEHVFSGGLYRNVHLVVTDPLHVIWFGTFVTTPKVSKSSATINLKTEVRNDRREPVEAELRTVILDPDGKTVSKISSKQRIAPGDTVTFDQDLPAVKNPQLWDIGQPNLYRAVSQLNQGDGKPADHYETTFGLRWFEWTADKGFFLNGRHVYLRGANIHQDQAGWGDAVPDSGHYRDVRLMKEAGFNFLRGSHYPQAPAKTRACDELGLLFLSENCFWGIGGSNKAANEGGWTASAYPIHEMDEAPFAESLKHSLRSMIRIHRNRPSIVAWSMSNEAFFSEPSVMPKAAGLLKEMVALSHELDPTRPAMIGGAQRPIDENRIDLLGDIAGYNGDGASIPAFQNPGKPSMVTEYGSVASDRPGKYQGNWGDLSKTGGKAVYDWRAGQAIWCGFDHGSIAGSNLGKMGIVDYFRIPKRAWYWYRNEYTNNKPPEWPQEGKPAGLTITADKTREIRTDGTDDAHLLVTVVDSKGKPLSNTPPVELSIVSGPAEFPTGRSIRFEHDSDIRIQDGKAAIAIRGWQAGETIVRATSPGLPDADLTLHFIGDHPYVEGETPVVQSRPYLRFDKGDQAKRPATYGPNNPTFASSSADGSSPGFAADDKPDTAWKPAANDETPSLTLDTEKGLILSHIKLSFPEKRTWQYRVEVSGNRETWNIVSNTGEKGEPLETAELQVPDGTSGRYIRVTFSSSDAAALSEIRVTGTLAD